MFEMYERKARPESSELATTLRTIARAHNTERTFMCGACTVGKWYRTTEPFPYVHFDLDSLHKETKSSLIIDGKCVECGGSQKITIVNEVR
jgi:hypothetical protein